MNASFPVGACLVKTERRRGAARLASFENAYDPFDPTGDGYSANVRGAAALAARTEKKNVARKRLVPPGDGRFFDGHH